MAEKDNSLSKLTMPILQVIAVITAFVGIKASISSDIDKVSEKIEIMATDVNKIKVDTAVISTSGVLTDKRILRLESKVEKLDDKFTEFKTVNK